MKTKELLRLMMKEKKEGIGKIEDKRGESEVSTFACETTALANGRATSFWFRAYLAVSSKLDNMSDTYFVLTSFSFFSLTSLLLFIFLKYLFVFSRL